MFDQNHYVPLLKCKRGELNAVAALTPAARRWMTPLFDLLYEADFDPNASGIDAAFDARAVRYVPQLVQSWGINAPLFIDAGQVEAHARVGGTTHIVTAVFSDARTAGLQAVPVTSFDRDPAYQAAVRNAVSIDSRGACLRLELADLDRPSLALDLANLMASIGAPADQCDVIVDLSAVDSVSNPGLLARMIVAGLRALPYAAILRSLTLVGGAFPQALGGYAVGTHTIPRIDWLIYNAVRGATLPRIPAYGDYATVHPVLGDIDPVLVNPSASVRYTREDYWLVLRGQGVKTPGGGKYTQFYTHATTLVSHPDYCGSHFSAGDQEIHDIASGTAKAGNLETWVRIGVNHHITFVAGQMSAIASGPSGTSSPGHGAAPAASLP
ncbi:Beta protein [Azospirillum oryzae]|uniref:Beta protein n=1 Tax=Azospirillum oryzae TaxID=286727 RepID=A0A1X7HCV3_9PROT|nr:beta family protein [Azospirillum oryzae]SMF83385.1 Beta protein [Azospirillum oryzae]